MKTYALSTPEVLEPFWFNKVRHGLHAALVADGSTVTLDGVVLRLRGEAPACGTAVRVWLSGSGFFVCATLDEIEQDAKARRDAEAAEVEGRRLKLNAMRGDADAFNARIAIPVKWDVGIKDVLSGLSDTSWGDGRSKRTVEHIVLLGDLQEGRLRRQKGDLLCTSSSSSNGMRWSGRIVERSFDGNGEPFRPKVTCKACIALAKRWKA